MSKEQITGAEALMRSLQAEGVDTIFGYPGGNIMPVYDALYDYTSKENPYSTTYWCAMSKPLPMRRKVMHE